MNSEELEILGTHEKETIIHECEMIAKFDYIHEMGIENPGKVIFYLDNDDSRYNLLGAFGKSNISNIIMRPFIEIEMRSKIHIWLARMPSPSNLSDLLSYGKCEYLNQRRSMRFDIDLKSILKVENFEIGIRVSIIRRKGKIQ